MRAASIHVVCCVSAVKVQRVYSAVLAVRVRCICDLKGSQGCRTLMVPQGWPFAVKHLRGLLPPLEGVGDGDVPKLPV